MGNSLSHSVDLLIPFFGNFGSFLPEIREQTRKCLACTKLNECIDDFALFDLGLPPEAIWPEIDALRD